MKKILALVIYLATTALVGTADAEFSVGGYYTNFSTIFNSPLPDASMTGVVVNRLRFNLSYAPADSLSFALAYDFTPRIQDPLLFRSLHLLWCRFVALSCYGFGFADLSEWGCTGWGVSAFIIILIGLRFNSAQILRTFRSVETQLLGGVRGLSTRPILLHPTPMIRLDTEDRVGVDVVRVRIPVGVMGEVDTGYIFGNAFDFDKSAVFLRTQFECAETDFSVVLLAFQRDLLIGLDVARGIGGAGVLVGNGLRVCYPLLMMRPTHRKITCVPL